MAVSIKVFLDTRRKKKTGKYPLKLRVTFQRKVETYLIKFDLSETDYKKLSAPRISEDLQIVRKKLNEIENAALTTAHEIIPFKFDEFEEDFIKGHPLIIQKSRKPEPVLFSDYTFDIKPYERRISLLREIHSDKDFISVTFLSCIRTLLEQGRIGSALNYQDAYNSLKRFRGNVRFEEITVSYLNLFEQWMVNVRKNSLTTVGIKLRALRAVFNEAIENGIIRREKCYPFGRRKYQIPTSRNVKKALNLVDIKKIYDFDPDNEDDRKAKDFWLFCYFGNGMNPKDMALLKYKNIDGDYLNFYRAKTERTTRKNPKLITVFLNEDMKNIIKKRGVKDKSPNNFIFPIVNSNADLMRQFNAIKALVKFINNGMRHIGHQLMIDKNITNMVSRHTFSTVLKRSGVSTEFIQESLGHMDKRTTENYLDSFEKEMKKEFAGRLVAFK